MTEDLPGKPMDKEMFLRKWEGTHTEMEATAALRKGSYKGGNLMKNQPGDKNIHQRGKIPGKNKIEYKAMQQRAEDVGQFVVDAVEVRGKEILDPETMPFKDLLNAAIKLLPTKVETHNTHEITLKDIMKASVQIEKVKTIDA